MALKGLERNIFQRLLGICVTRAADPGCWVAAPGAITVNLAGAPELSSRGGAVRLEGKGLRQRVLLFRDDAGVLRALENRCAHMGRRVDPVPGEGVVQCCSVNAAVYDCSGAKLAGPGAGRLEPLAVREADGAATITL